MGVIFYQNYLIQLRGLMTMVRYLCLPGSFGIDHFKKKSFKQALLLFLCLCQEHCPREKEENE
jgi:hypothetical protein